MSAPMVSARGLTKVYPAHDGTEKRAVDGIDFDCEAGEIFGLLGLNGAGKTTTQRMLSTALTPTAGVATIVILAPSARTSVSSRGRPASTTGSPRSR